MTIVDSALDPSPPTGGTMRRTISGVGPSALNLGRQLGLAVLQVAIVTMLVFVLVNASPGDPAVQIAGELATPEQVAEVRTDLGLDRPMVEQYGSWLGNAITGDLGTSLVSREPATELLSRTVPVTLSLVLVSLAFSVLFAAAVGMGAALRPGGVIDRLLLVGSSIAVAVPSFWLAIVLISQLAIERDTFPALGYVPFGEDPWEWLRHLTLPALALSTVTAAELARQLRGSLVDVLSTDYILTARASGVPLRRIVGKHALKNALVSVTSLLGVRVSVLLGGSTIIETIFNMQGLGRAAVSATLARDIPVVLAITSFTAVIVLVTGIIVNLVHPLLNPRLRR